MVVGDVLSGGELLQLDHCPAVLAWLLVPIGLAVLITSTVVVGYGNKCAMDEKQAADGPQVAQVICE